MSSTRRLLINILQQNQQSYISGQRLADQLNISRNAIWKHMRELENDGYMIEAAPRLGYRIIDVPNKVSENTIKWGLKTDWLGKRMIHKRSVTSTQIIAHELAQKGAEHGTVVIADEQTEGRGRMRRPWDSKNADGIWLSIILRPKIPPFLAPQLTLLTATVLADLLKDETKIIPIIKWPNDLLIEERKVSVILNENKAYTEIIYNIILENDI